MKACLLCALSVLSVVAATQYYIPSYGYNDVSSGGFNSLGGGGLFQMIIFLFVFIFIIQLLFGAGGGSGGGYPKGGSSYGGSDYDYGYSSY